MSSNDPSVAASLSSSSASSFGLTVPMSMSPFAANAFAMYSAQSAAAQAHPHSQTVFIPTHEAQFAQAANAAAGVGGRAKKAAPKGRKKKDDGPPSARKRKAGEEEFEYDPLEMDEKRFKSEFGASLGIDGSGHVSSIDPSASAAAAAAAAANAASCRFDSSLGLLTKKFVQLLQESSSNGVLDLNQAALKLGVQKRRIYDITNVLEGIGLISKKSKNNIQWRGAGLGPMIDLRRELNSLRDELHTLEAEEFALDDHIRHMQETLVATQEFESNREYCYMTHDDIRCVQNFDDKIIIAIKAPKGTTLDVPDPVSNLEVAQRDGTKVEHEQPTYQAILKSSGGPIDVFVISNGPPPPQTESNQTEFTNAFTFPPSASNSPLHAPPLSPVLSSRTNMNSVSSLAVPSPSGSLGVGVSSAISPSPNHHHHHHQHMMGGLSSTPNSPFALTAGSSPYAMLASPGFGTGSNTPSVYQHHSLGLSQSAFPANSASPMRPLNGPSPIRGVGGVGGPNNSNSSPHAVGGHSLSDLSSIGPANSPTPGIKQIRHGSPMQRFAYSSAGQYSPILMSNNNNNNNNPNSASPFRAVLSNSHNSPFGIHSHSHSHSHPSALTISTPLQQPISTLMKLESPSNDPDYFMNLDEHEGLTDLYSIGRSRTRTDDKTPPDDWQSPPDEDNIFADAK